MEADCTSCSFLNVGAGTGYFSSIIASIVGKMAVHHAIEISPECVAHAQRSIAGLASTVEAESPTFAAAALSVRKSPSEMNVCTNSHISDPDPASHMRR